MWSKVAIVLLLIRRLIWSFIRHLQALAGLFTLILLMLLLGLRQESRFPILGLPIPIIFTMRFLVRGICRIAEINGEYEKETGNVIVEAFNGIVPTDTPGVLVKNHGPFTWGKDADEAVYHSVVLEQVAKMAYVSLSINPSLSIEKALIEKHYLRKHGPNAYYGQKKK
jgi:ribulose-5-phosphate 4-epimerase/fuculose-1-phosphate aldolase